MNIQCLIDYMKLPIKFNNILRTYSCTNDRYIPPEKAVAKCKEDGMVLFCPKTESDIDKLYDHMNDLGTLGIWTGIYKNGKYNE